MLIIQLINGKSLIGKPKPTLCNKCYREDNLGLKKCDCGGSMFTEKLMFKKISAFISPSGKEELYPLQIIVCDSCGKVPTSLNPQNMVPKEFLATKKVPKNLSKEKDLE